MISFFSNLTEKSREYKKTKASMQKLDSNLTKEMFMILIVNSTNQNHDIFQ